MGSRPAAHQTNGNRTAALGLAHLIAFYRYPLAVPTGRYSPAQIWQSSDEELVKLLKIPEAAREHLLGFRSEFDSIEAFHNLGDSSAELVALEDPEYPLLLAKIHDPPAGIFLSAASGASATQKLVQLTSNPTIAIVGARGASGYGIDAAELIAEGLSRAGVCVVSGMARGIDSAGHRGGLRGDGSSIAVLGCGSDVVYPKSNVPLYRDILTGGLVISEYPPGTQPQPWRFPARNRIIAGLSLGVVVVEAKEKSGALITADFCLDEGREVWTVPGSIFSDLSAGPHGLLRQGAAAVTGPDDIIAELGLTAAPAAARKEAPKSEALLTADEQAVLTLLEARPALPDQIATRASLAGNRVAAALITLELKGLIRHDPFRGYSR